MGKFKIFRIWNVNSYPDHDIYRFNWLYESGLSTGNYETAAYRITQQLLGSDFTPTIALMVSKIVDITQPQYSPIKMENIHEFVKSYLIMISFASIAMLVELIRGKNEARRAVKRGNKRVAKPKHVVILKNGQKPNQTDPIRRNVDRRMIRPGTYYNSLQVRVIKFST